MLLFEGIRVYIIYAPRDHTAAIFYSSCDDKCSILLVSRFKVIMPFTTWTVIFLLLQVDVPLTPAVQPEL